MQSHPRSVDPVHYFLNQKGDTPIQLYLEDTATEFQVQGVELDWVCVAWCGDFRFTDSGWSYHDFRGDRWCNTETMTTNLPAERVPSAVTRARQGMVVFVPPADPNDPRGHRIFRFNFRLFKGAGHHRDEVTHRYGWIVRC